MNTPEPCCKCEWCDWNVLTEEDPTEEAWCNQRLTMGNEKCLKFKKV